MRWIYLDPTDDTEESARTRKLAAMDHWWERFAANAPTIERVFQGQGDFDLPAFMHETLGAIDNRLMWEFGPAVHGKGHRLVITPESERQLRPLVNEILKRAPKLAPWEFHAYRVADDIDHARVAIEGRTGCPPDALEVRASINSLRSIDLLFQGAEVTGRDDKRWLNAAFVSAETLLGEETLDKWIGEITVERPPRTLTRLLSKASRDFVSLASMRKTVNTLVDTIRQRMPDTPYFRTPPIPRSEERQWSAVQLSPSQLRKSPHWSDLRVAITADIPLFHAAHLPGFASERFSRLGEVFCYLKIDGSGREPGREVDYRVQFEDAVEGSLAEAQLGCTWGGGSGTGFCYVDLVVVDVARAIGEVRRALRAMNAPRQSWLLFYDAELADEWVGIYDDTPPPPVHL